jgi:hypothetical protein
MKVALIVMVGTLLVVLGGCQSDMTGPALTSESNETLTASSGGNYPDVPVGDAYFETMIGRNELGGK